MPRRYHGCPGSIGGDELGENGGVLRTWFTRRFLARKINVRDESFEPHAPNTTVLAQTVATYRTRATLISPWHALRAQSLSRATGRPGSGSAIWIQSRLHLDCMNLAP